jgi:lipid-A-disaccharide synthase
MSLRIVVSAGEVSGDRHLSRVVSALRAIRPDCVIRGMAGEESERAGVDLVVDCYRSGATMGFGQVVRSAGKVLSSLRSMTALIRAWRPDLVILVDYPDFNMRLAKYARESGAKVFYYIPPKVWAWRSSRVKKIKRYVDHVAAIFPFEKRFFADRGYENVTYVGHPLGDRIEDTARERSNALLILPGSRTFEVEKILPPALRVFERLRRTRPDLSATIVVAPNMSIDKLRSRASELVGVQAFQSIRWFQGDPLTAMREARAGILKSGTCNLEGAVAGLPFVSVYSGSYLSKVIASALVPLKEFSPVNILRSGTVKEVFAVTIDEDLLEAEVVKVLEEGAERSRVVDGLLSVRKALQVPDSRASNQDVIGVPQRVAHLALSLVPNKVV